MQHPSTDERPEVVLRAVCEWTRFRILHLLQTHELPIERMAAALQVSDVSVGRHLDYLRRAGLIACRRVGIRNLYSLPSGVGPMCGTLLRSLEDCFANLPQIQADDARSAGMMSNGPSTAPHRANGTGHQSERLTSAVVTASADN
jgi:ArsR family transcriptional regulator, arsenate/arsenite/antimonite-responsive transcriptional repressor